MSDQEKIDQFNRDVDNLLKGNPLARGMTDAQRYATARQLARSDFSARSRMRETTRARLLARAARELLLQTERKGTNSRVYNLLSTFAFGAMMLLLVFGLGWMLTNTLTQPATPTSRSDLSENIIAYQSDQDGNAEIYRMDGDGSNPVNLTQHPADDTAPAWSPDGEWIAFLSNRSGKPELFVMDAEGERVRQLTNGPEINWFPPFSWSPDGKTIAVTGSLSMEDENHAYLYLIDVAEGRISLFIKDVPAKAPQWLSGENELMFVSFDIENRTAELYIIDTNSQTLEDVSARAEKPDQAMINVILGVDSSPDGASIAYLASYKEPIPDSTLSKNSHVAIHIYDRAADSTETLLEIRPTPNGIRHLVWSPDGNYLAYLQDEKSNGCWTIHLIQLATSERRTVEGLCYPMRTLEPDWTTDGEWLVYPAYNDGSYSDNGIVAVNIPSVFENPGQPEVRRLTGENGGPINPKIRPIIRTEVVHSEPTFFRSEANHLEVSVPEGWTAYEGEEYIARPFTGIVAFNSWGEQGFWVRETTAQENEQTTSYTHSPQTVLAQIPQDGAYIVLVWQSGGPIADPEIFVPDDTGIDLSGLWQAEDCRQSDGRFLEFNKFERVLRLEIYCGPQASDATAEEVNALLSSWRFDNLQTPVSTPQINAPLTLDSDSETIRKRILYSYQHWQTMWVDAQIDDYNGATSSQRVQVWLNQPAMARVLTGPVDGAPSELWISDGQMTRTGEDLSGYGLDGSYSPPLVESNVVYPHPMTGILPTPLSSLLFPSGLAQRGGTYRPIAIETIAGRETLVVEWNRPNGPLVDRFWVDTQTDVILRQQNYGKGADGALTAEYLITNIQFDLTFPSETFNRLAPFPPAFSTAPDDIYSEIPTSTPEGGPDTSIAYGEIYMLLQTTNGNENTGFVHFPASCLVTGKPCPQPSFVNELPEGFGYPGLNWSPDGDKMVYQANAAEDRVWLLDRTTQTWTMLDAPYMSGIAWSPDGGWLAGQPIVRGTDISNPILLVASEGTDWVNLMTDVPGFKSPISWLDNDHLLLVNALDNEMSEGNPFVYSEFQIYSIQNSEITVVARHQWDAANYFGLGIPVLSPDRSQIAYSLNESNGHQAIIIDLKSGEPTQFPISPGTTITGWSPDGTHLVLAAYSRTSCEIHLIPIDGSDDRLLFNGDLGGFCSYVFSPDGAHMLIPAPAQNPTVPRMYVVDVATNESHLIELPDVGVPFEWPVVSWLP